MKTILEVYELADLTDDTDELIGLIEAEAIRCRDSGDLLGAGEWLVSALPYVADERAAKIFAETIALWASPLELKLLPVDLSDLIAKTDEFVKEELATAVVAAVSRFRRLRSSSVLPHKTGDLAFRLSDQISKIFSVHARRPEDLCIAAAAQLENAKGELLASVDSFLGTGCANAKVASVEVVKRAHRLRELTLAEERLILGEVDILLGPLFRKFCESCERSDVEGILGRVTDIQNQARRIHSKTAAHNDSTLWSIVTLRVAAHISEITDEAIQRSRGQTTPSLGLSAYTFKIDLSRAGRETTFAAHLLNQGEGRATGITFEADLSVIPSIELIEPKPPFDIGGHSEQFLRFGMILDRASTRLEVVIKWKCKSATGHAYVFEEILVLEQQRVEPNWDRLVRNPPYTTNPVRTKEQLFGRQVTLNKLILNASAGTSTFLWGQKRVGKTSVLQVLSEELKRIGGFVCVLFRMGELRALHEGQLAYTIAERVTSELPPTGAKVPRESDFGAGLGRLVPFADALCKRSPQLKFLIIIDEFDDFDPAFYTGERGKLFVKALRSLSEIGFTFLFVGSERMKAIYSMHTVELNKWVDLFLDCIESREDRKALIVRPVTEAIEYHPTCVEFIVEYCGGNPFYMHLLCSEVFQRCYGENRTYVSESDVEGLRETFIRSLGETNFSHFWDDNPVLDQREKVKQTAENCLVLSCIASLGGTYESTEALVNTQEGLGLGPSEQLGAREIATIEERLRRRNLLNRREGITKGTLLLPILTDWLCQHAQLRLLPIWREFCAKRSQERTMEEPAATMLSVESTFPIAEDDLLAVSQSLMYLGRQKDVSELRIWLKQFDDDVRVEIAFLLLKRLAEKGYVTEGAKLQALSKVEDAIVTKRKEIGRGTWSIIRGRYDNLCVSYIDSEMKSGATIARELAKRLRPGKTGASEAVADWMRLHYEKDPLIVFVDDFSGTGRTLHNGLEKFYGTLKNDQSLMRFLKEGRVLCYLLYAFPEAVERLRKAYPEIHFLAAHVFDEEIRALDEHAGIFQNAGEINFAKDVLLQIGRELYSQHPLGYGDMGVLVAFHNTVPNNTLPIFWSSGIVNEKPWKPLFPRA